MSELQALEFKSSIISSNINSFLKHVLQKSFLKNKSKIFEEVLLMKEDKEVLTKSQIQMMVQMYQLLNLLLTQSHGQEGVEAFLSECVKGLERGVGPSQSVSSS